MTAARPNRHCLPAIYRAVSALLCLLFFVSALITGTLAWRDYSQHKTNAVTGTAAKDCIVLLNKFEIDTQGNKTANPVGGAEFALYKIGEDSSDTRIGGSYFTDNRGQIIVRDLTPGEYYFIEINPGYGYTYDKDDSGDVKEYHFTFDGETVAVVNAYNRRISAPLVISKIVEAIETDDEFEFTVTFSDEGSYTYTIDNGEPQTLQSGGNLYLKHGEKAIFEGLPVGIQYTVQEKNYYDIGYTTRSTGSSGTITQKGCTAAFFNKIDDENHPLFGSLTVRKSVTGEGGDTDKAFTFTVTIGEEIHTITLKSGESKVFEDIPLGTPYNVVENDYFSEGYAGSITGGSGTVAGDITAAQTNEYVGTVYIGISGKKSWDMTADPDAPKPESITVYLKNGDITVKTATITPDENKEWKYTFKAPKYDENGETINYTIEEAPIAGYISTINGTNIKNTRIAPALYEPVVKKTVTGDIPVQNSVFTFKLTAADEAVPSAEIPMSESDTVTVTGAGEIKFGAIKYREAGTYIYTVTEVKGNEKGYTYDETAYTLTVVVEQSGDKLVISSAEYTKENDAAKYDKAGFINTYVEEKPGVTAVKVTKKWVGDTTDSRPESIQVQLYRDSSASSGGVAHGEPVTLSATNNWTHTWTQLDEAAVWTVDEPTVPAGYTRAITGDAAAGFVITNTTGDYPPGEKITISGTKTWNHGALDPKYYPGSIVVLVKVGDAVVAQKMVTAEDHWTYIFRLPKYDSNSKEIVYTIDEQKVAGYQKETNGYELTNIYDPNDPDGPGKPGWPGDGPKTGDNSKVLLWFTLMLCSLASLIILFFIRQKKYKPRHVYKDTKRL